MLMLTSRAMFKSRILAFKTRNVEILAFKSIKVCFDVNKDVKSRNVDVQVM